MKKLIVAAAGLLMFGACAHPSADSTAAAASGPSASQNAANSLEQDLVSRERQSWAAWQSHDGVFWQHFLSEDHVDVHNSGIIGKAAIVDFISRGVCTITSYNVSDFHFVQFSPDSAVLVYHADQTIGCGHPPAPTSSRITSGYTLRNGQWENTMFVDTPIPPPAPAHAG